MLTIAHPRKAILFALVVIVGLVIGIGFTVACGGDDGTSSNRSPGTSSYSSGSSSSGSGSPCSHIRDERLKCVCEATGGPEGIAELQRQYGDRQADVMVCAEMLICGYDSCD